MVEDDYDSEFRYDVAPVPALASLDRSRVAYLGTAAKSVAPSLRLGWLVAPPDVLDLVNARRLITHEGAPWPVQRAFLALLRDGYVDKVVRTARRVYADRAPRVAAALSPYAELAGPLAGMYSTWLLPQADALRAREAARRAGFEVNLLSDYCRTRDADRAGRSASAGSPTTELDRALAAVVVRPLSRLTSSNAANAAARSRSILRPRKYAEPQSSAKMPPSTNISGITKPRPIAAPWITQPRL